MSNSFAIALTATDRFSVTFQTLKDKASEADKQLRGGAAKQREGFDSLRKSINSTADSAQRVAESLGLGRGVAGGLFSIGAAGGIVGGAVAAAAAVGALTVKWSAQGQEIDRTSRILGVNADTLQTWRAAAQLAGGTAEGMTATLSGLGRTLQDATWGRNPAAAMLMRHFGIGIQRDASGGIDVAGTMGRISEVMQQIGAQPNGAQLLRQFTATMGMPEESAYVVPRARQQLGKARGTGIVMVRAMIDKAIQTERDLTSAGMRLTAAGYGVASTASDIAHLKIPDVSPGTANQIREQVEAAPLGAEMGPGFMRRAAPIRDAAPAASAPGHVSIKVEVPPGARVSATSDGPPLRVERSGVAAVANCK